MSEELSLVIKNQQAIAGIRHIDWNKDELIERVRAVTAKYKGLVYTDDDITNARTDRAELNAIKNSISDSRIQVKKFVMAPYDQFEAEVAEVTNLIIEAVKPIDEAIKTHDENQKADKKKQLVAYFDSIIGNLAEAVTFYWIIHNTPEDVIFIADDDIEKFVYRMSDTTYLELPDKRPDKERVTAEIERIAQLIYDLGIGYAFDQPTMAPYAYDCEFKFVGMPGHIRWINKKALKATYDPDDPAASDVDMMMQELLHNRIILRLLPAR